MISRRRFLKLGALAAMTPLLPVFPPNMASAAALSELVFAGPPAPLSLPLARLADEASIKALASSVTMRQWRTPDILRAWVVSGEVQAAAVPVNAAAALYNKGVAIRLLDVNKGGVLSVLSADPSVTAFEGLAGKSLLAFYRGDIPDLSVRLLARKSGMAPDKDIAFDYAESPFEVMGLFLSGRAPLALLPEPAATAAMMKAKQAGKAVTRIPLQPVWEKAMGVKDFMPLGGVVIQQSLAKNAPEAANAVARGLPGATAAINADPAGAAKSYAGLFELAPPLLEASLTAFPVASVGGPEARNRLEFFLSALMETSPKFLGGKLPDAAFYAS